MQLRKGPSGPFVDLSLNPRLFSEVRLNGGATVNLPSAAYAVILDDVPTATLEEPTLALCIASMGIENEVGFDGAPIGGNFILTQIRNSAPIAVFDLGGFQYEHGYIGNPLTWTSIIPVTIENLDRFQLAGKTNTLGGNVAGAARVVSTPPTVFGSYTALSFFSL